MFFDKNFSKEIFLGCSNLTPDDQELQNYCAKFGANLSVPASRTLSAHFNLTQKKSVKAALKSWRARGFKVAIHGNSAIMGGTKAPLLFLFEGTATLKSLNLNLRGSLTFAALLHIPAVGQSAPINLPFDTAYMVASAGSTEPVATFGIDESAP